MTGGETNGVALVYPESRPLASDSARWSAAACRRLLPHSHRARHFDVSLVLPMYNTAPYVVRTLESVLYQPGTALQIILVDDGSEDEGPARLLAALKVARPDNVLVLRQPNRGVSAARNLGAKFAVGDYLASLDTDDLMAAGAYAKLHRFAEQQDLDVVFCRSLVYDSPTLELTPFYDAQVWDQLLHGHRQVIADAERNPELLRLEPNANPRLVRRAFIDRLDLRYPEGVYFEDLPVHIGLLLAADRIGLLDDPLYLYRINRPGKITSLRSRRRFDLLLTLDATLATCKARGIAPEQGAELLPGLLRIGFWCGAMTPLADRDEFFDQLGRRFGAMPDDWVREFRRRFPDLLGPSIVLWALRHGDTRLLFDLSLERRASWRIARFLIADRRLRNLLDKTRKKARGIRRRIVSGAPETVPTPQGEPETATAAWPRSFPRPDHRPAPLSPRTPIEVAREDARRLDQGYYAHRLFSAPSDTIVLDLGARSGLFALYHAAIAPHVQVLAVEPDPALYSGLADTVARAGLANLHCHRDRDRALAHLARLRDAGLPLGLIKITSESFDPALLETLVPGGRIELLCGEYPESSTCPPARLQRLSCRLARRFFWRNLRRGVPLTGRCGDLDPDAPEVSVIVPAYGVERYLDQCLASLTDQTLERMEIIVVDDGSRDASGRIADRWAERDPRIVVLHQANAGCAAARSNGLHAARGRYVGFVDGDDWVDPPMFERLFEAAVAHNAEVAQCGYREAYADGPAVAAEEVIEVEDRRRGNVLVKDPRALTALRPTIWRRIYQREFLLDRQIDFVRTLPRFDDLPFQFEVFMHARRVAAIPEVYYHYRQGRLGQDIAATDERLHVHFPIFAGLRDKCEALADRGLERALKRVQLNTHQWAYDRIETRLKRDYRRRAAADLFDHRLMVHRGEILLDAWRISPVLAARALAALVAHVLGPAR